MISSFIHNDLFYHVELYQEDSSIFSMVVDVVVCSVGGKAIKSQS